MDRSIIDAYLDADTVGMIALAALRTRDHLALLSLAVTAAADTDVLLYHEAVLGATDDGRVRRVLVIVLVAPTRCLHTRDITHLV